MDTVLFLSNSSDTPIYEQIMDQLMARVVSGAWPPGSPIPSIRQLASANAVSVITVKRAYLELEHLGVIVTRQGRGSFVADSPDLARQIALREFEEHGHAMLRAAARLGFGRKEVTAWICDQDIAAAPGVLAHSGSTKAKGGGR